MLKARESQIGLVLGLTHIDHQVKFQWVAKEKKLKTANACRHVP
jgi:hypothetical protein